VNGTPSTAAVTPVPRRPPTSNPAEQAWTLMQQFVSAHSRHEDLTRALGFSLGAGRGKILFQLRHGALTSTQLAEAHGYDAPYTTLIVDKLEAHGLVERRPHPDDRRRKLVALTPAGHSAIADADTILLNPPQALNRLAAQDLQQLRAILNLLVHADEDETAARRAAHPDGAADSQPGHGA